jgi:hypothetical protein
MNERIRELEKQCWDHQTNHLNTDKFAELIVQECVQAFEAEVDTWNEMEPYQGIIKRKGTQAIKQHFGVE